MNNHDYTYAGQLIIAYFRNHQADGETDLINPFNQIDRQELHHCFDDQTLLDFVISSKANASKRSLVIETLLRRAMRESATSTLFQFLLTKPNRSSRTAFYETFEHDDFEVLAEELSEWTIFGLTQGFLTKEQYQAIHLTSNEIHHSPLLGCVFSAAGLHAFRIGLLELSFAVRNQLIPQDALVSILQQPCNLGVHLVEFAFMSCCQKIIRAIWLDAADAVVQLNDSDLNALDYLALENQVTPLQLGFEMLDELILGKHISDTMYDKILLTVKQKTQRFAGRRILNIGFVHEHVAPIILAHAQTANKNGWLSNANYATFLLDHPRAHLGFNNAHESILYHDSLTVYRYLTLCLTAAAENKLSIESFISTLLQSNRHGYSVFHQAINNHSISQAEVFIHLARTLLPSELYQQLLKGSGYKKNLRCTEEKPCCDLINSILKADRFAVANQTQTDHTNRFFAPLREMTPRAQVVIPLITLVHDQGEWTAIRAQPL